jgi:hypothetical protein
LLPGPDRRAAAPDQFDIDHVNRLGWTALLEAIILRGGDRRHSESSACSSTQAPTERGDDLFFPAGGLARLTFRATDQRVTTSRR